MFIKVRLLNGFSQYLWYKKPDDWSQESLLGSIVRVPLRTQHIPALVLAEQSYAPKTSFELKEAESIEPMPEDKNYNSFISKLAAYYHIETLSLVKRIRQFVHQKEVSDTSVAVEHEGNITDVMLTQKQQEIVNTITPYVQQSKFYPAALHGVTGSGKTEVYKSLIRSAIENNKSVLLLLPEVTLAIEFAKRLQKELPDIVIVSFHSGATIKQKRLVWQRMLNQEPTLIIGVHLPVLLPIANLGLIIIDEEHETGYQEKKHPKINSKEAALLRAQIYGVPILLGSATPSLSTLYNTKHRGWHFFQLKDRFAGALPEVKTVFLNDKKQRKSFWISNELRDAIRDRLAKKEQIIIFINRRGYSFFVQCKACSFVFECPSCSVSLTLHAGDVLSCHYCDHKKQLPNACPPCKEKKFLKKGIGTQQAVTILETMFPSARIARADLDMTQRKKQWQQTMDDFHSGALDIIVGTQTITKGYHFPKVTLVGILWADLNLHFPIFNAAETCLQQLIQVAGRAGRQSKGSLVIVQAMDDHKVFEYLNEIDYLKFYESELATRSMLSYPPVGRLVEIEIKHTNEMVIERESHDLCSMLQAAQKKYELGFFILGPAKPPIHKIKNMYSRKIYIKGNDVKAIGLLYRMVDHRHYESFIYYTPNPVT